MGHTPSMFLAVTVVCTLIKLQQISRERLHLRAHGGEQGHGREGAGGRWREKVNRVLPQRTGQFKQGWLTLSNRAGSSIDRAEHSMYL